VRIERSAVVRGQVGSTDSSFRLDCLAASRVRATIVRGEFLNAVKRGPTVTLTTNRFSIDAIVILLLLWIPSTSVVGRLVDGAVRVTARDGSIAWVSNGSAGRYLGYAFLVGCLVFSVHVILSASRARGVTIQPATALVVMSGMSLVFALVARSSSLDRVASVGSASIILVALVLARPSEHFERRLAIAAFAVLASAVVFLVIFPTIALAPCRIEKCSPFGVLWQSFFPQENNLALYVALCIPIGLGLRARTSQVVFVALAVVLLVGSGSRTGLVAGLIAALGFLAATLIARDAAARAAFARTTLWVLRKMPLLFLLGSVWLFFNASSGLFTNRGSIYGVALAGWIKEPFLGPGREVLRSAYEGGLTGGFLVLHEHGESPYLLTNGGIIVFVLFVAALLFWCFKRFSGNAQGVVIAAVASVSFLTEPIWEISVQSGTFWSVAAWIVWANIQGASAPIESDALDFQRTSRGLQSRITS
jgi:hypothetical protein